MSVTELPRRLKFVDEYAELPGTARARYVGADDGKDYVVKGPALTPEQPYVAVNELLCALLARDLGLPVPDPAVLEWRGELLFARPWMPTPPWRLRLSTGHVMTAINREAIYGTVVFDSWVLNNDRHTENVVVRTGSPGPTIVLIDHSRCPVRPGSDAAELRSHVDDPIEPYVQLDSINDAITKAELLTAATANVVDIADSRLEDLMRAVPAEMFRSPTDPADLLAFLAARRDKLSDLMHAGQARFPRLDGSL